MVIYRPVLSLRAKSGIVALKLQGSLSMSIDHVTSKGQADFSGLGCCLGPGRCQRAVQSWLHPSAPMALWSCQADQLSYNPGQIQCFELVYLNIYPIDELLALRNRLVL